MAFDVMEGVWTPQPPPSGYTTEITERLQK